MINFKHTVFGFLIAISGTAFSQTPATDLVQLPVQQLELGQSIDAHDQYTIVGSKFGLWVNDDPVNGVGMLFQNGQFIRSYRLSPITQNDYLGNPRTVGIGQHAIVLGARDYQQYGYRLGAVGIVKKTWDGTHYDPNVSQIFTGPAESDFGHAVAISDHWVAVGAPNFGYNGGVKMIMRNHSTAVWEDKGWVNLPDLGSAQDIGFGWSVDIYHDNMIIGTSSGNFYIYRWNGSQWNVVTAYQGSAFFGNHVAISDQYAVSIDGNDAIIYRRHWDNTWILFQTITNLQGASDVELDGSRMVIGRLAGGPGNKGEVRYYELKSHPQPGSYNWVYDFVHVGNMYVNPAASNNGMQDYRLLGFSVDIQGNTVVSGAPNTSYQGYADGAGFRAQFHEMQPVQNGSKTADVAATTSEEGLYLFPNPASGVVNLSSNSTIISVTAVSSIGMQQQLNFNGNQIELSNLNPGLYTISVITENGTITDNVVVK